MREIIDMTTDRAVNTRRQRIYKNRHIIELDRHIHTLKLPMQSLRISPDVEQTHH
jgi:hypothetical protein